MKYPTHTNLALRDFAYLSISNLPIHILHGYVAIGTKEHYELITRNRLLATYYVVRKSFGECELSTTLLHLYISTFLPETNLYIHH